MTLDTLLRKTRALASDFAIPYADYLYIISHRLRQSIPQLQMNKQDSIPPERETVILDDLDKLNQGQPPQYIVGKAWFYGLELDVNPAVLIPRPETEGLVELVVNRLQGRESVLDIGTGSGAIAIAIKHKYRSVQMHAVDISESALQVAAHNAAKHLVEIEFFQADMWPEISIVYDWIVSNPPYISSMEMEQLEPRVKDFEPNSALFGGSDGLDFYRKLLCKAHAHLKIDGILAIEHGAGQKEAIIALAKANGWKSMEAHKDLSGRDRYLIIKQ